MLKSHIYCGVRGYEFDVICLFNVRFYDDILLSFYRRGNTLCTVTGSIPVVKPYAK